MKGALEVQSVYKDFLSPERQYARQNSPADSVVQNPQQGSDGTDSFAAQNIQESEDSKSKRSKAAIALSATLALGVLSTLGMVFRSARGKEAFKKFVDKAGKTLGENEAIKGGTERIKDGARYFNFLPNLANAKDVYFKKLTQIKDVPIARILSKGLAKFDTKVSGWFERLGIRSVQKAYTNSKKTVFEADDALIKALDTSGADAETIKKVKDLIKTRQEQIKEFIDGFLKPGGRFRAAKKAVHGLDKDVRADMAQCYKESGPRRRLFNTNIAEDIVEPKKREVAHRLSKELSGVNESTNEINKILEKLKIDAKQSNEAFKDFEKAWAKEGNDLLDKLRDIAMGCALTDCVSAIVAAGTLGAYLHQADSKEERVSEALTKGLPILSALGISTIAAAKMVSGVKAMSLGIFSGVFASLFCGKLNKSYLEGIDIEKTLPSIKDAIAELPDAIADAVA